MSTIVKEMRTPSSSSSVNRHCERPSGPVVRVELTNIDGLDADALLDVSRVWVIVDLVCNDLRLAERVHKGRSSGARCTWQKS